MTDAIGDILGNKSFEKPDEITIIKDFVRTKFKSDVGVTMQPHQIVLNVSSSALAANLRMQLHELQKLVGGSRRLVIRIGRN